jgi:Protein of unknown function (DUF4058)
MPSPFPGMNPYFEQPGVWRGFHTLFIGRLTEAIASRTAPRYVVRTEESVYVERGDDSRELVGVADVAVKSGESVAPSGPATPTLTGPVTGTVRLGAIRRRHLWLTVRDRATREVVTVIEVLSPSNKRGEDRGQYLRKRRRILRSAAHLVEIDLLRGGPRMPMANVPPSDYRVMVSRQPLRPDVQVWAFNLTDLLPAIPIPLRTGEPEPLIALKPLVDSVYDGAVYQFQLYDAPPDPPLSPAEADWARQFLPAA